MSDSHDIIVLGAGMVGVSTALNLQRGGRQVTLVDRRDPGEETSFGNAGVIEGTSYIPIAFPREPVRLLRYATNIQPALHFHWRFLLQIAPWLYALFRNSSEERLMANGRAVMTLTASAIDEHKALMGEAGVLDLLRETGWLRGYRSMADFEHDRLERRLADETGQPYTEFTGQEVAELEPHLKPLFARAVLWHAVASVSDPGAVVKAYASLFGAGGGSMLRADARRISQTGGGWRIETDAGELRARELVLALGPWSSDLISPLGYRLPLAVKRGYHRHYGATGDAMLSRPVVDTSYGYVLAPMARGIRITTGIEFAARDAAPSPVQLRRAERHARELFPLGETVDEEPWMGRRPCLPDTRPVIGPAPYHRGLWFNFGHAHLGFTLGPVSGRLLSQMIAGEPTLADPAAFRADRF